MTGIKISARICYSAIALALATPLQAETLEQAWAAALGQDRLIQSGQMSLQAAEANLAAAKGARLPALSLDWAYTRLDDTPTAKFALNLPPGLPIPLPSELSVPFMTDKFHTQGAAITLPLFTSGRITHTIQAAESGTAAGQAELQRTTQEVKLALGEHYLNVLRSQRLLQLADKHQATLQTHRRDVQAFYDKGLVPRSDTLTLDVALAEAQQKQIQARNAVELAQAAYNRALQRPLDQPTQLQELDLPPLAGDLAQWQNSAEQQRPELQQLAHGEQALRAQAKAVRGQDGPQVALIGAYNRLENPYLANDAFRSVSIGMKWNVFDGGIVRQQAAAVSAKAEGLRLQQEETRSLIQLQVRQAMLSQRETDERLQVAQASVALAEESLKVARDRYGNGLAPQTEVLDAETRRLGAETSLYQARYDRQLAILRLKRAIGEL